MSAAALTALRLHAALHATLEHAPLTAAGSKACSTARDAYLDAVAVLTGADRDAWLDGLRLVGSR